MWSYDSYLCQSVAGALTHLRDNGHGYFGRTPEEYNARLTRIIDALNTWGRLDEWEFEVDRDEHQRRYREAQKAFRRLGEVLGSLWD